MQDKVVVITGGSSGIGKALAEKYATAGSKVVITGRNADRLNSVAEAISDRGGTVKKLVSDVSLKTDCERMVADTVREFGGIDVLINNAGIAMRAPFRTVDVEVLEKVMQVNFWGAVYCTKAALPHLVERKGSIVAVSSIGGCRGLPGRSGYSASKFAMHGFFEALRTELLPTDVHILLACPGFTASKIRSSALTADGTPQGHSRLDEGKLMSAEQVAHRIYNAVRKRKRLLVLTRQGKLAVFLNKWLPGPMDKVVFNHYVRGQDSSFSRTATSFDFPY